MRIPFCCKAPADRKPFGRNLFGTNKCEVRCSITVVISQREQTYHCSCVKLSKLHEKSENFSWMHGFRTKAKSSTVSTLYDF